MPLLDPQNLPVSSVPKAVEVIRAQLAGAQGLKSKLNQSVLVGVNALLKDATEQTLQETQMPCIRIGYRPVAWNMASNSGVVVNVDVAVSVFFVYAVPKGSYSVLPQDFADLRDAHIRWNLEHLKRKSVKPNDTMGLTDDQHRDNSDPREVFWWWTSDLEKAPQEDETPFNVFGLNIQIPPSSGFTCSRVDLGITVKNHAKFL